MEIKLNELIIQNFKGVKNFTLKAEGKDCLIRGVNGSGKTTCMDAFLWLLFGQDSQGKSDFAIKPLDENGNELHNLETSVEGNLDIDGQGLPLKKKFKEKYVKKRGTTKAEFTGHTTDYFVNDVPTKKKEWDSHISQIIGEDTFRLLTSPMYFNSLHWEKRRKILLEVCGDISDQEVIDSNDDLTELPGILGRRSIDDHRKVVDGQEKQIDKRLKEIPTRIDELRNSLVDIEHYDAKVITEEIKSLEEETRNVKDNTEISNLRKQKARLEAKLLETETAYEKAIREAEKGVDEKIDGLQSKLKSLKIDRLNIEEQINRFRAGIERNEGEIAKLRDEFKEVAAQEFKGESVCPSCGQDLPEDQVHAAIDKHNSAKAARLESINIQGRQLKADMDKLAENMKVEQKNQDENLKFIEEISAQIPALEDEKAAAVQNAGKEEENLIQGLESEIEDLTGKMESADDAVPDTAALEERVEKLRNMLSQIDMSKHTKGRIENLKQEERTLAKDYEEMERQSALIDRFTVAKVNMLEDRINEKFSFARFKLFNRLVNGGIEPTCETLFNGTPFSKGASTGEQIKVGLDIINTLQEHYGIKAVIWLDHAESITFKPEIDCQMISLYADEKLKTLEVTYDG